MTPSGPQVFSVHVLPMWVLSGYSIFLSHSRVMHLGVVNSSPEQICSASKVCDQLGGAVSNGSCMRGRQLGFSALLLSSNSFSLSRAYSDQYKLLLISMLFFSRCFETIHPSISPSSLLVKVLYVCTSERMDEFLKIFTSTQFFALFVLRNQYSSDLSWTELQLHAKVCNCNSVLPICSFYTQKKL